MARQFTLKKCVTAFSNAQMQEYFDARKFPIRIDLRRLAEEDTKAIIDAIGALPPDSRAEVERDFQDAYGLGDEGGVKSILTEADDLGTDLAEHLSRIDGHEDKALWTLIHAPDAFEAARTWRTVEVLNFRRHRKDLPKAAPPCGDDVKENLSKALVDFFAKEARGRFCEVDILVREGVLNSDTGEVKGGRTLYCAYPEDYATTDIGYDDHGKRKRGTRRTAFEIIFQYFHDEGRLSLYAKGDKKRALALQRIFVDQVLDIEVPFDLRGDRVFELDGLKSPTLTFPTPPEDGVEYVLLKSLRLSIPGETGKRVTFEASENHNGNSSAPAQSLHAFLQETLNQEKRPLDQYRITHATMQVKFPGKGHRGSVTFAVTWPDSCSLRDEESHMKIKQYLKDWGIDRA
jgi:hypothetical protein